MIRATLSFFAMAALGIALRSTFVTNTQVVLSESPHAWSETCQQIANSISAASEVHHHLSKHYANDIRHWAASSTQTAVCSFEPGTPEDVGIALRIIGQSQTPFAIRGGGHTGNPRFSSTPGVQIAMSRFSDVDYDPTAQTVTIGAGLIWDNVYAKLEPHGVNVVGGRVSGVGVAGFILGGGYSWLTNQHGLTIDTVQAFELVTPNGTALNVTETSNPDLFFALKGGLNNFGIVTRFTLKTFPQTYVWGGFIICDPDSEGVLDKVNRATANFAANNKDPKAAMLTTYNAVSLEVLGWLYEPVLLIFYDGPTKPEGIFDEFLSIPSLFRDIRSRPFSNFVHSLPVGFTPTRAVFNSISVTGYPLSLLELIVDEAKHWTKNLSESVSFISYTAQPFLPTHLTHSLIPSAYPPARTHGFFPVDMYFAWDSPHFDEVVYDAVRKSAQTLQEHALQGGLIDADTVVYPNYAIFDTPLVQMYGANVPRLQAIKAKVDPHNVMGLAGGFKF